MKDTLIFWAFGIVIITVICLLQGCETLSTNAACVPTSNIELSANRDSTFYVDNGTWIEFPQGTYHLEQISNEEVVK